MDIDDKDNVYIVDAGNNRIQKFNSEGDFTSSWGSRGSAPGQLLSPHDIALDFDGNSYLVEQGNYRVLKFDPKGQSIATWGT